MLVFVSAETAGFKHRQPQLLMSTATHPSNFSEDWSRSSWVDMTSSKPSGTMRQELEPLNSDPILEPDVASPTAYAQGDTIGSAHLLLYLVDTAKYAYLKSELYIKTGYENNPRSACGKMRYKGCVAALALRLPSWRLSKFSRLLL